MSDSFAKFAVFMAVIAGTVAIPLAIAHHGSVRLSESTELVQRRTRELDKLRETNAHLTRLAAQAKAQQLTDQQLTELLRMRSEAGALRR